MDAAGFNLAIETSGRTGSVAIGRADELLEVADLPPQRRHAVDLMPVIDRLTAKQGAKPADIREIYVSVGPGSFTGLRIGITTAKVIAQVTGAKLAAVPTLDATVRNAPPEVKRAAVCLNAKRGQCFTGLFERGGEGWRPLIEPSLWTPAELMERAGMPLAVIGDAMPAFEWPAGVTLLDPSLAVARAEVVWQLGRAQAKAGRFVPAMALVPLYVRLPEAEEVWQKKQENVPQSHRVTEKNTVK